MRLPRGGELAYQRYGPSQATPVLLIRPVGGTISLWAELAAELVPRGHIIAFNPAGVGASTAPARCSVQGLAEDAKHVLDALGVRRAVVLGQSLGSFVALRMAACWPERVGQLVLVSAARRGLAFAGRPRWRGMLSARCLLARTREVEVCLLWHVLSPQFLHNRPERVHAIATRLRAEPTPRATLLRHDFAGALYLGDRDIARVRCPALVVAGASDDLLGTAPQKELAHALHAELRVLPNVGHDVSLEAPRALADLILARASPAEV